MALRRNSDAGRRLDREYSVLERVCRAISVDSKISVENDRVLKRTFKKRYNDAISLARKGFVKKYVFHPGGRELWVVRGRRKTYQVIPRSRFCTCEDYYFRVLEKERSLCYHLLAQRIASALTLEKVETLHDEEYQSLTKQWKRDV